MKPKLLFRIALLLTTLAVLAACMVDDRGLVQMDCTNLGISKLPCQIANIL